MYPAVLVSSWEAVIIRPVRTISRKPERGSSETAREAPLSAVKIQSDPHGDMGSQAEMTWPPA
jgi:hypothetical protein